jgi:hypothetical protein
MNYTPHVASGALRRHSQAARLLVVLGAIALLALPAAALLSPQDLPGQAEGLLGMPPGQPLDLAARWRTALVSLLPVGCGLYALRQLWTLFGEYLQGRVFGMGAQGALMRFAWTVLAGALALPFARALMSVAASMGNPPGQRFVTLGLYWHDGLLVLLGVVLVSIARACRHHRAEYFPAQERQGARRALRHAGAHLRGAAMPARRPAGVGGRAPGVTGRRGRLAAGLLLSLLLHAPLLWWGLAPDAAPPEAGQGELPRLQVVWVQTPAPQPARLPVSRTPAAAPPAPAVAAPAQRHGRAIPPLPARTPAATAASGSGSDPIAMPPSVADAVAPAPPADAPDSHRSARAMGRLLDSAAGRDAVQSAARQDAARPRIPAQREDPLASGMREAAHGDCMKGEFKGGGMGLLSVPMLAAAALKGECSR